MAPSMPSSVTARLSSLGSFFGILHWNERHPFEARVEFYIGLIEPIVVGARDRHRVASRLTILP